MRDELSQILIFIFLLAGPPLASGQASSGYAEVDITPQPGGSMPGYFTDRISTGVLDPLLAKVLVLTRGRATVAIVAGARSPPHPRMNRR
jgi:hypothetical protein